ncbi:MAG TPA: TonB family protein [Verrucomicrobiae bacterium]|nr:TonB family protein [Verrucomicrobiae bacterium]
MAPSLKELETVPAAPSASAPATPQTKPPSPNDTTARPQPVALEIPVTVNGARTVEGSDKRAPFSESTQTVLVFPHGAVIRIATALAPGQLVFLTNEKSKKEVVCQVIKSKSSGSAGAYVELQFTEPSPGFWGVQLPGAAAPAAAPRPAAPAPKAVTPVVPAPIAVKPPVAAKPIAPTPVSAPPAKSVTPPPAPPAVPPAPVSSQSTPLITPPPPSPIAPPEKVPVAAVPPTIAPEPVKAPPVSVVPAAPVAPEVHATHPEPHSAEAHLPAGPVTPLRDYSKQIDALFSSPKTPAAPAGPESHVAPVSSDPSTEQLKQEAARLQAQLSSMLFTEKPAATPAVAAAPKTPAPIAEISNKLLEAIADEPKAAPVESKPVPAQRKRATTTLGADEEVKVPSWLAPLQHTETAVPEASAAPEASTGSSISVNSEESFDALVTADAPQRPETAVFGGQLLGEASAAPETVSGSKKGLFIGIAAALMVVAGGGYYYFHQSGSTPTAVGIKHSIEAPVASASAPANSVASVPGSSTATVAKSNVPALTTQPEKNFTPAVAAPAVSTSVSMAPSKNAKPAPKNAEPAPEEPKSVLGDVHLAAPVVGHSDTTQPAADTLQNIDTKTIPGDSDAFASAAARRAGPAAPLPVGGEVKQAQLLKAVPPVYPALAKAQHVSGSVRIDALIDASGNVEAVKIISGPTLLHRAAIEAVKQWKYSPAMLDGEATSAHLTITVDFHQQ